MSQTIPILIHDGGYLTLLPSASRASSLWENQESLSNIWGSQAQFTDESSHLFSLYLSHAEKHDKELAENWIAGADGILVFVRATVGVTCYKP